MLGPYFSVLRTVVCRLLLSRSRCDFATSLFPRANLAMSAVAHLRLVVFLEGFGAFRLYLPCLLLIASVAIRFSN